MSIPCWRPSSSKVHVQRSNTPLMNENISISVAVSIILTRAGGGDQRVTKKRNAGDASVGLQRLVRAVG